MIAYSPEEFSVYPQQIEDEPPVEQLRGWRLLLAWCAVWLAVCATLAGLTYATLRMLGVI